MKVKKEYLIIILVIAGLAAYLFLRNTDRTNYMVPIVPEVEPKKIAKIEINQPDSKLVLEKKDSWEILPNRYKADKNKINNILDVIKKLTLTTLVSESKNYLRYDLSEDKKIVLKAWTEDQKLSREFEAGRTASSYSHTFVKLPGDSSVYLAAGDIRSVLEIKIDDLRDKTVLSFSPDNIKKIIFIDNQKKKKQVRELSKIKTKKEEKEFTVWKDSSEKQINKEEIDKLFNTLKQLECDKYINDKKKKDLKEPLYSIKLIGGIEYTLSIFKSTKDNIYRATSSENDYPFILSEYTVDKVIKILSGKK